MTAMASSDDLRFDSGRLSLDLMATLGNRSSERLPDPEALAAWLVAAGLLEPGAPVAADDLGRARALRAALFGLVGVQLAGARFAPADVEALDAFAAVPAPVPRLLLVAGRLEARRPEPAVGVALGTIARDAIDLLGGPDRERLRECAADDCSGIFVDDSRGSRRRWCSSARCGNRARVAAHRARRASRLEPGRG